MGRTMTNSVYNVYSPDPNCCTSECSGICDPLAEHYTITFSGLPWGLPTEWVIHKENFRAPKLLELARLQAWTLKPALPKP